MRHLLSPADRQLFADLVEDLDTVIASRRSALDAMEQGAAVPAHELDDFQMLEDDIRILDAWVSIIQHRVLDHDIAAIRRAA